MCRKLLSKLIARDRKKYQISTDGKYLLHYLLDKYINGTRPDDNIERYEQMVMRKKQTLEETLFFERATAYFNLEQLTEYDKADFAAIYVFCTLLAFGSIDQRETYYNYINDEEQREVIKEITTQIVNGKLW